MERTLLLNTTYEPLRVISWQRAVGMMCLDKVEVIRSYSTVLRAVSWSVPMPSVIRLKSFVRRRRVRIAMTRRNIFVRDQHRCQYCLRELPARELTCDHVKPRAQGGKTTWENVVAACGPCNRRKGGRTPEEARMRLASVPHRPRTLPVQYTLNVGGEPPAEWADFLHWLRAAAAS